MRNSDPWLRFYVRTLNNPKVQRLPGSVFKGWVNLLCLAKELDGDLPPLEDIAFRLRLSKTKARNLVKTLNDQRLNRRRPDARLGRYAVSLRLINRTGETSQGTEKETGSNVSSNGSETAQRRVDKNRTEETTPPIIPPKACDRIFRDWNSYDALTTHRVLSDKARKAINARLKEGHTEHDLSHAIGVYARLCHAGEAPGYNKWTLAELMGRGAGDWIDKLNNGNGSIPKPKAKHQTAAEETAKNMEVWLDKRKASPRTLIG